MQFEFSYKRELAAATQKENLLLQSKVQLKLDWQRRCQEIEQKQYAEVMMHIYALQHLQYYKYYYPSQFDY